MKQLQTRAVRGIVTGTLIALIPFSAGPSAARAGSSADETPVEDFRLKDYRGKEHSLAELTDARLVVLVFLGTECPLAKLYAPRLERLSDEYGPRGVAFLGLSSNVQDSITELAAYARIHGIEFPLLKDLGNVVADRLAAVRTPEALVLDERRVVRYRGRIDDQYGVGTARERPVSEDLRRALDELLAGEEVSQPRTEPVGCHIGRIKHAKPDAEVTYSNQIARLLQRRCVECHRPGEIAPFALTEYDEVVGWAEMIAEVVREERMPPWHADPAYGAFSNDRRLSDEEKELLYRWVEDGAPQGDPARLPEPRAFVSGWELPREPDLVLPITEEPFEVAAEGPIRYQGFVVDPGFEEDKWVQAVQILPGNRAVVHHILMFAVPKGMTRNDFPGGASGYDGAFLPGVRVRPYPDGLAKRIAAGSDLVFQVHYTSIGSVQLDQSQVGFLFVDEESVTHEIITTSAYDQSFRIPAHESRYRVEATSLTLPASDLIEMNAHMHLRGSAFRYEALFPDGTTEILLDIPHYDFNWQTAYRLRDPEPIPEGTRIRCVAYFDNSADNLNNPDPSLEIGWGRQTYDEMMIGYFDVAVPRGTDWESGGRRDPAAQRFLSKHDKDRDGRLARSEAPFRRNLFERIDRDGDGKLTLEELTEGMGELKKPTR